LIAKIHLIIGVNYHNVLSTIFIINRYRENIHCSKVVERGRLVNAPFTEKEIDDIIKHKRDKKIKMGRYLLLV